MYVGDHSQLLLIILFTILTSSTRKALTILSLKQAWQSEPPYGLETVLSRFFSYLNLWGLILGIPFNAILQEG